MGTFSCDKNIQMHYDRFMEKIIKDGRINEGYIFTKPDGVIIDYSILSRCWTTTASVSGGGYGQIGISKRGWNMHTLSYWLYNGQPDNLIPGNADRHMVIGHICDNSICANPEHLEYISQGKNVGDAVLRIRGIKQTPEPKRTTVACNACRADTHHKCEGFPCTQCVKNKIECVKEKWKPSSATFVAGACSGASNANATPGMADKVLEIRRRRMAGIPHGQGKVISVEILGPNKYTSFQAITGCRQWNQLQYFPPGYFEKFPEDKDKIK